MTLRYPCAIVKSYHQVQERGGERERQIDRQTKTHTRIQDKKTERQRERDGKAWRDHPHWISDTGSVYLKL